MSGKLNVDTQSRRGVNVARPVREQNADIGCRSAQEGLLDGCAAVARKRVARSWIIDACDDNSGAFVLDDLIRVAEHGDAHRFEGADPRFGAVIVLVIAGHEDDAVASTKQAE